MKSTQDTLAESRQRVDPSRESHSGPAFSFWKTRGLDNSLLSWASFKESLIEFLTVISLKDMKSVYWEDLGSPTSNYKFLMLLLNINFYTGELIIGFWPLNFLRLWSHPPLFTLFKVHCAVRYGDTFHLLRNIGETIACPFSWPWWVLLLIVEFCLYLDDKGATYMSHVCILLWYPHRTPFILLVLCIIWLTIWVLTI